MYIALWEWDVDVVVLEGLEDGFHDVADYVYLFDGIDPADDLEVDAVVAKLGEDYLGGLFLVDILVAQFLVYGFLDEADDLAHVGAIGYAEWYHGEYVAMVLREVLVVLGEELGVGEGNDGAVDGVDHRGGVADGADLSFGAVALYPVANLDATSHEGHSIQSPTLMRPAMREMP